MEFLEESLSGFSPISQAFAAGLFTWAVTALGASAVFFRREVNQRMLTAMYGFAAGVMLAASFWSLLAPAIAIAEHRPEPAWLAALIGFLLGGACLWGIDQILPHLHPDLPIQDAEGPKTQWRRSVLLVLAVTIHNIPEGLAVGVGFGGTVSGLPSTSLGAAVALALGIGLQNFPEGLAVSMPLRGLGMPRWKAFFYGQMSGIVEPISAVMGAAAVVFAAPVLPYALAFAAGAMVYVVVEELIPACDREGQIDWATLWLMVGFGTMMSLDVALGG
ncbi:MAG: ZIP family metal transporter [Rubinisphaera brasiliensis]|uniref:Zinc/iron permease n=1 Tax=Rubinisphaera brasiliensis (strain ATCC 49424 / DSM 5305 / JCM 21570 / IAM 15109 / NBRC 103401 / IFAM 1448) TaxID=756272 RepID=F0SLC6_RUBBR|nr:ZIP family metal transporter [Rubinisphaera brasiliensis]ADY62032.1 zinc/iron permease [Rubinisphaera brasiliensis DSM 5305]MBB02604.1 ZIP family metal transporter [Planctomyces sp.]MBR9800730.1 ZIP family metal transporter [bacterium]